MNHNATLTAHGTIAVAVAEVCPDELYRSEFRLASAKTWYLAFAVQLTARRNEVAGVDNYRYQHRKSSPFQQNDLVLYMYTLLGFLMQLRLAELFEGYISSHDYERADDAKLTELAKKIRE